MVRLQDIVPGSELRGLLGAEPALVVSATSFGDAALEVVFRLPDGSTHQRVLFREDEAALSRAPKAWTFDAPAQEVVLALEARRIQLASLFDPYLAVRTSAVEPLPHQITAVYQEMLPRLPLRYVLADDPGAGKTVMCGLLIKEMMARGALERCLVVCPGSLCEQWQDELLGKFGIEFRILTNDLLEAAGGNVFAEEPLLIARMDKLARDERAQELLRQTSWDLVVVDEAHKMSASYTGGEVKMTKRYKLGRLLGTLTENYLLLTATPHNGKPADFNLFMALVDPDRFEGAARAGTAQPDTSDCMRRLVKEELLTFEGTPLFPERRAATVSYDLSPGERALYEAVTDYVRQEFNRADALDGTRRQSVGFALTLLQRRLASSPEAIYQSLRRRRERLRVQRDEARRAARPLLPELPAWGLATDAEPFDEDDIPQDEAEGYVDAVLDSATAARTVEELDRELVVLERLEAMAAQVRAGNVDRKWEELSRLLQDAPQMFGPNGREKLIIFTEHKDTLRYLAAKIGALLGSPDAVLTIQGGMGRDARRAAEERFWKDPAARVLVATDAAGEGINLQCAHLMINYDLPWNPNRLEQRFGRIHRIGQTEVCWLWNLVAADTREGAVWQRLFEKLEEERQALGGRVFNILGELRFDNASLKDLMLRAVRYGADPRVRARLNEVVDATLDQGALKRLLDERALAEDVLTAEDVGEVRARMDRAAAQKLEPHCVQDFFMAAMEALGGRVHERETGRFEVTHVPREVRERVQRATGAPAQLKAYERLCFERERCELEGRPPADLLHPGHPLVAALSQCVLDACGGALRAGTVLVDEGDPGREPRLLACVESCVRDGCRDAHDAPRTVSRELRFVEIDADGAAVDAGCAPHLDYRAPSGEERQALAARLSQDPLAASAGERARACAVTQVAGAHLERVRAARAPRTKKVRRAVEERLRAEVRWWEGRAWELDDQAAAGREGARVNAANARERAAELRRRLDERLRRLELEEQLHAAAPRLWGGALVVPAGLLAELAGAAPDAVDQAAREAVEAAAMEAVIRLECELGNAPKDVSANRGLGYDIESAPQGPAAGARHRFIEVKGRAAGAATVTVTRNEVLCALNNPDCFLLAVVEVAEGGLRTRTTYLRHPFEGRLGKGQVSGNFSIAQLRAQGKIVLERDHSWQ